MIRFGDICCGIGGLSQGFEDAGLTPVLAQDTYKPALDTYVQNFPNTRVTSRDISTSTVYTLYNSLGDNDLDVLAGGPPVGEGNEGKSLLRSFSDLAVGVLPDVVVFEGEVRVFSDYPKHTYSMDLIDPLVSAGYRVKMERYDVADFGVPHHRIRALLIAARRRIPHLPIKADKPVTVREALARKEHDPQKDRWSVPDIPSAKMLEQIQYISQGNTLASLPDELKPAFWKELKNKKKPGGNPTYLRRLDESRPSVALGPRTYDQLIHPTEDRFITLREAFLLQSFPSNFRISTTKTSAFQLLSRSTPPAFAERIAEAVVRTLDSPRNAPGGGVETFLSDAVNRRSYTSPNRVRRYVKSKYGILEEDRWGENAFGRT